MTTARTPAARSWPAERRARRIQPRTVPGGTSRSRATSRCPRPSGGDQGLADQAGGVGAARQQDGVEHDVGDVAAGAPGPVRAHRPHAAAQLTDGALAAPPPSFRAWPQSGQRSMRRASAHLAAVVSKTSIIIHPARLWPGRLAGKRGSWCCSLAPGSGPRNLKGLVTLDAAPSRRRCRHPPARAAGHSGPGAAIGTVPPPTRRANNTPGRRSTCEEREDPRAGGKYSEDL